MNHFRYHSLCLPENLTLFEVPFDGIRRWDDSVLVFDVEVESGLVLRHYSFYDRWFEVNCSMNREGRFVVESWPEIDGSFNIDIAAPLFTMGNQGFGVDLLLDVLADSSGERYVVKDEDEFEDAIRDGWITEHERRSALEGLEEILGILAEGRLVSFLEAIQPFDVKPIKQTAPMKPRISDFPQLEKSARASYYGKRSPG